MRGVRSSARYMGQIMTHIALLLAVQMLMVTVHCTASPLDALHALMVQGLRCCIRYLFSS